MQLENLTNELKLSLKAANLAVDQDLQVKCVMLCEKYNVSTKEFADSLEAFLINTGKPSLSIDGMGKLEQHIMQNLAMRKKTKYSEDSPSNMNMNSNAAKRSLTFSTPDTIDNKNNSLDIKLNFSQGTSSSQKFSERSDKGKVLLVHNENLSERGAFEPSSSRPLGKRCNIASVTNELTTDENEFIFDNVTQRYRYMYTSLDERTKALDKHLLKIQKDMCKHAGIDEEKELQQVGVPSQEAVWVCGRICNEANEGKINSSSIILEGSRRDSFGRRVKLEVKDIQSYSLFPGQVVLVEGIASSGRVLVAKRIVEGIPRPMPKTAPGKLLEYHHSSRTMQSGQPLNVLTVCGPYTTNANLSYEPLQQLFQLVLKSRPDVVIMVGPFVDISQPLLESGDVNLDDYDDHDNYIKSHAASYEMVFVEKIVRDGFGMLFNSEDIYGTLATQFVLVPSLLDAHHEFVFPQPPFADREAIKSDYFDEDIGAYNIPFCEDKDPRKRIHLMPNPCMFRVNEILFGVTSNDVIFGLSSDETSQGVSGGNRLARIAGHVLQQQSFSPQFPTPPGTLAQMDFRQSHHWQMGLSPDVLILPSKLNHMIKDIHGTLVVNPGTLSKGNTGGTYAELNIHPQSEDTIRDALLAGKTHVPNQVSTRTRAAIIKI